MANCIEIGFGPKPTVSGSNGTLPTPRRRNVQGRAGCGPSPQMRTDRGAPLKADIYIRWKLENPQQRRRSALPWQMSGCVGLSKPRFKAEVTVIRGSATAGAFSGAQPRPCCTHSGRNNTLPTIRESNLRFGKSPTSTSTIKGSAVVISTCRAQMGRPRRPSALGCRLHSDLLPVGRSASSSIGRQIEGTSFLRRL